MSEGRAVHPVLIASAAYVSAEIAAEFGLIPPAFLPLRNRRLYTWQVEEVRKAIPTAEIWLSLPAGFEVCNEDRIALEALGVTCVFAPVELTLGESLSYVALSAGITTGTATILHGDTLITDYPYAQSDAVSVGQTRTYYPWADYVSVDGRLSFSDMPAQATDRTILTGVFCFEDMRLFLKHLVTTNYLFVDAIGRYSTERPMDCIEEGGWFDLGHLHTYFQSRRRLTTERHFNRLEVDDAFLIKSSDNANKIRAERDWFRDLPDQLKSYVPLVLDNWKDGGKASYRIEYHHLVTLNDLYVFGRLPLSIWRNIFESCSSFMAAAAGFKPPAGQSIDTDALYRAKTISRLEDFARARNVDLETEWTFCGRRTPSLLRIAEEVSARIPNPSGEDLGIVHGDFCFSNVMFDFRSQRIKLIDPRGISGGDESALYGDVRYETAKLHHSVVGLYDHILARRYRLRREGRAAIDLELPITPEVRDVQALFERTKFNGRTCVALHAPLISVLLFLSMLPLHADDPGRQDALMANALRLYLTLDESA